MADPEGCAYVRQRAARLVRERFSVRAGADGYRQLLGLRRERQEPAI